MLRTLLATLAALTIVLATLAAAAALLHQRRLDHAQVLLQGRLDRLQQETRRWQAPAQGAAEAGCREEARRTLDLLAGLYRQEHQLWSYYETIQASNGLRESYERERLALERTLADRQAELARLEARMRALRPSTDCERLDFTPRSQP